MSNRATPSNFHIEKKSVPEIASAISRDSGNKSRFSNLSSKIQITESAEET